MSKQKPPKAKSFKEAQELAKQNAKKTPLQEFKELAKEQEETNGKPKKKKNDEPPPLVIKKAKLTSEDTLVIEYSTNGDTITIKRKSLVHPDLKAAYEELVPHFALLCDLKEVKKIAPLFQDVAFTGLQNLKVICVSLNKSTDDASGVVITGIKQIGNGIDSSREIVINSPFTSFDADVKEYPFSGLLAKSITKLKEEVIAYLGGKCTAPAQTVLELAETEEEIFYPWQDSNYKE